MYDISNFKSILDNKPVSDFVGRCVSNYLTKLGEEEDATAEFPSKYVKDFLSDSEIKSLTFTFFESLKFGSIPDTVEEIVDLLKKTGITSRSENIIGIYPVDTLAATKSTHKIVVVSMPYGISKANKYCVVFHSGMTPGVNSISVLQLINHFESGIYDTSVQWNYNVVKDIKTGVYDVVPTGYECKISIDDKAVSTSIEYTDCRADVKYEVYSVYAGDFISLLHSVSIGCNSAQLVSNKDAREEFERMYSLNNDVFAYSIFKAYLQMGAQYDILKDHFKLNVYTYVSSSKDPVSLVKSIDGELREVEFEADNGHWTMDCTGVWSFESSDNNIGLFSTGELVKIEEMEIIDKELDENMKKSRSIIKKIIKKAKRYQKAYFG